MTKQWRKAIVIENKSVSKGSYWIKLQAIDDNDITYQPGNVLSLGLSDQFGEIFTHPYTVSKSDIKEKTFEHLYRLIPNGRFTPILSNIKSGQIINFHGIYHNPIADEISENAEEIIGISTGVGIGPLYGFSEKVLREGKINIPITLYVGYREAQDVALKKELDFLQEKFSNFKWHITYSNPDDNWKGLKGRVTESVPHLINLTRKIHFHLVGNGNMIGEFVAALIKVGIAEYRITTESYFNHKGKHNPEAEIVNEIVDRFNL